MTASVIENGERSPEFDVSNGTKQGCGLAPLLFCIFFSMMLLIAFQNTSKGIPLHYLTDGDLFNTWRFQAPTKVHTAIIRDLLFADDCALVAHTLPDIQELFDRFADAARRFSLTVSLKKTEVMLQSYPTNQSATATVMAGDTILTSTSKFCYLGSYLSNTVAMNDDIMARIAKGCTAFGGLQHRLWHEHSVFLKTKVEVYRAVVFTTLLFGSECWTLYRKHIKQLEQFHMRCLRNIAGIRWQDRVSNTRVLEMWHFGY